MIDISAFFRLSVYYFEVYSTAMLPNKVHRSKNI